jgi:hypothetical protein
MNLQQLECADLVELVTDCLEEALEPDALLPMLDHLHVCKGCDDYLKQMVVTLKILARPAGARPSAELEANLLAIHAAWRESRVRYERA